MLTQKISAAVGVPVTLLLAVALSSCSSSPTSPTLAPGGSGSLGLLGLGSQGGPPLLVAGKKPGRGGGGGTPSDFVVTVAGLIQTSAQVMQSDRDNKKALSMGGTVEPGDLSVDFSAWLVQTSCTWTAGYGWASPEIEALKATMTSPLGRRGLGIEIIHNGDGITGLGSVTTTAIPEGSDNWLSYCFNTGFGRCQSVLTSTPGDPVRVYELDGGGIRAVGPGEGPSGYIELACPDATPGSPDVTITVVPI